MKRIYILRFALLPLAVLISSQPDTTWAQNADPAQFIEEVNWLPFTSDGDEFTTHGFSYDLISAVFDDMGMPVTLELVPQRHLLKLLESRRRDGATVITSNAKREKFLPFSERVFQMCGFVYLNPKKHPEFTWKDYSDMRGF